MKQSDMMGMRVTVTRSYWRTYKGSYRKWEICEHAPSSGWIVGFRTIWDGRMDYETGEYGERIGSDYFIHGKHHECALVVFSPRQKPVNVPLDGFTTGGEA